MVLFITILDELILKSNLEQSNIHNIGSILLRIQIHNAGVILQSYIK